MGLRTSFIPRGQRKHFAAPRKVDGMGFGGDAPRMVALNEAYAKLSALSDERAQRVLSLIEELAELEARENAEDIAAARETLADGEPPVPWDEARARLDAIHGIH